jgi:hypothetical protein
MPDGGVSSEDALLPSVISFVTDGGICEFDFCLLLRSTLVPSEHGKPFELQRSHFAGHSRGVGAHYYRSVS